MFCWTWDVEIEGRSLATRNKGEKDLGDGLEGLVGKVLATQAQGPEFADHTV